MKPSIVILLILSLAACRNKPTEFTDKRVIVKSKQTVKIAELNLAITNNGCGRKWIAKGDEPSYEKAYCDLVIKRNDTTINAGDDFDPVYIGDVMIEIDRMNPWGREEDSVPPGGCRLWVRRVEGR